MLASALLEDLNRKHGTKVTDIAADVHDRLRAYNWPGNVRELRNVLERAVILAGEGTIQSYRIFRRASAARRCPRRRSLRIAASCAMPVGYTIEQAERALIELTLEHTKHNKTRAAEILGISQKTLFNKLKEYGAQGAGARLNPDVAAGPAGPADRRAGGAGGGWRSRFCIWIRW